jgi:hypothetical protein
MMSVQQFPADTVHYFNIFVMIYGIFNIFMLSLSVIILSFDILIRALFLLQTELSRIKVPPLTLIVPYFILRKVVQGARI